MYDPLKIGEHTRNVVCRNDQRKYYRFRPARFYGGISTADCLGCCLRCVFCWSWDKVIKPEKFGKYYTPEEVAMRLVSTARSKGYSQIRISGNEPTICRRHLISVLELIPKDYLFILETNGILIGNDEKYAEDLSRFPNLYVRVSLKGTCEEEFSMLTGAIPERFQLQLKALEHLVKCKVNSHPACMISFSSNDNIRTLRKRLRAINPDFKDFEVEELILYPAVEERLKRLKIDFRTGYKTDRIPFEQI
jgi:uncharacterized Fe-S cluster-containing radical SAM superfamily protein